MEPYYIRSNNPLIPFIPLSNPFIPRILTRQGDATAHSSDTLATIALLTLLISTPFATVIAVYWVAGFCNYQIIFINCVFINIYYCLCWGGTYKAVCTKL